MDDISDDGHSITDDRPPRKDNRILVSVIIPAFNRIELLGRAVSSALNQTHHDIEVLVVDDGSQEDVKAALGAYDDVRLSYHRRDDNRGISAARNYGISLSKGKYLAFLDSDDAWKQDKIATQMERFELKGAQYKVCYTNREIIDDTTGKCVMITDYCKEGDILSDLLFEPKMATSSLMVQRDLMNEIGGFDERIHWGEDWDLYLRLTQHTPFACVKEALTLYHLHDKGRVTDNLDRNPVIAESLAIIYENNKPLFQRDRQAWGKMLVMIGYYQASSGQRKAARKWFLRSARHDPFQKAAYLSLARLAKGWESPIEKGN